MPQPSHRELNRALEDHAAAVAAQLLGANAERIDSGLGDGLRDFDLVFPDGSREPFEVTLSANEATRVTWRRIFGNPIDADLKRFWHVTVPEYVVDASGNQRPLDRDRYARELVPILTALEALEVEQFSELDLWRDPRLRAFRENLLDLKVESAGSLVPPEDESMRVHLSPSSGGAVDIDAIAGAIEREAEKADNRRKLAKNDDARRSHLCVVIDLSEGLAHLAMRVALETGQLPRLPQLPPEITTAWAMTQRELIVTSPPGEWQVHLITEETSAGSPPRSVSA